MHGINIPFIIGKKKKKKRLVVSSKNNRDRAVYSREVLMRKMDFIIVGLLVGALLHEGHAC